jgi:putative endonuclease
VADWFVYVIRCADSSLYTGISTNVARRLAEHASGGPRAAKYLRGRGPLTLAFSACVGSRAKALSVERRLKTLSRERKEALLAGRMSLSVLD